MTIKRAKAIVIDGVIAEPPKKLTGFEAMHAEYLEWVTATFPDEATEDQWLHLAEEFEELKNARNDAGEYADVLMLLCCVARGHGINIFEAFAEKFAINKSRRWEKTEKGFRHK